MAAILRGYQFLPVPLALGLILPAAAIPWIGINFMGNHQFSPIDIVTLLYSKVSSTTPGEEPDILNLLSSYDGSYYLAVFSLIAYVSSIATLVVAAAWRSWCSWIALTAGILAIASAACWVLAVDSLKESFSAQAALTGGIIGEEFKGHEQTLADSLIRPGIGQYFVACAGAVAVLTLAAEKSSQKVEHAVRRNSSK